MSKILVSPVAFNENIKLKRVIERFLKSPVRRTADYLIVDDGSTDGTTELIRSFEKEGVRTIKHPARQGVGSAIRSAIHYAKENHYDILVIMAGNDKDNPEEIPALLAPLLSEGYDLIQGSRYLEGDSGPVGEMPSYRKFAVRLHSSLFSLLTGKKMTDTTNGFRAIKLSLFDDLHININQKWLDHYELEPYILFKAVVLKHKVKEVPVTKIYPPKKLGYTKMRPLTGWWSFLKPLYYLGLRIER